MELYAEGGPSIDIRASRLQSGTDVYDDRIDGLENIIELVNNDGGWIVCGCGKHGVVNDVVMLGDDFKNRGTDAKILSKCILTRVVHIHPANRECVDCITTSRPRT